MAVPSFSQIRPGISVSIVLKADQRTGREVQGQVEDILTRRDHPRGIKVRLKDGRVGRVQSLTSGFSHAAATTTLGDNIAQAVSDQSLPLGSSGDNELRAGHRTFSDGRRHQQHQDVRLDEHTARPSEQVDLFAYAKPLRQQRWGRKSRQQNANAVANEPVIVSCPVCEEFESDEASVARHVGTHFEAR